MASARTWTYSWMSSDGFRHEGEMQSPDKDSVYAELRARGIRAIRVTERIQPIIRKGFSGLRKRDWCVVSGAVLVASLAISLYFVFCAPTVQPAPSRPPSVRSCPRKWLPLPPGFDLKTAFRYPHEVYLSRYAMPGVEAPAFDEFDREALTRDFREHLSVAIGFSEDDLPVVAELKGIVSGMKEDARKFLGDPDGVRQLGTWLAERQLMERRYREEIVERIGRGTISKESANAIFRTMGMEEFK